MSIMKTRTNLIVSSLNKTAQSNLSRPIITWGIFDGVHCGHQKIIQCLVGWARQVRGTSIVLTFREHPQQILKAEKSFSIISLEHRFLLLKRLGVDLIIVTPFTRRIASLVPDDFVKQILVKRLGIYGIVASEKIQFGRNRQGNITLLKKLCQRYRIHLKITKAVCCKNKLISSTCIREAVRKGNLKLAEQMLGRRITLLGRVVHGAGLGRKLGIPTANLALHHHLVPPRGVYASLVNLGNSTFQGLTNIGIKPTFTSKRRGLRGESEETVEVHILNFNPERYKSLYGKDIELEIITKLRDEKKWAGPEELILQIERDKQYFLDATKDK